jgi:hypothetical protein
MTKPIKNKKVKPVNPPAKAARPPRGGKQPPKPTKPPAREPETTAPTSEQQTPTAQTAGTMSRASSPAAAAAKPAVLRKKPQDEATLAALRKADQTTKVVGGAATKPFADSEAVNREALKAAAEGRMDAAEALLRNDEMGRALTKAGKPEGEQGGNPTVKTTALNGTSSTLLPADRQTSNNGQGGGLAAALAKNRQANDGTVAGYKPTDEQAAILTKVKEKELKVLVIEAGAGAGKTSTLKMIEAILPGMGQYTAFNKSLVEESKAKFRRAQCNTTHSLAFRAVGKRYSARLNSQRMRSSELARRLGIRTIEVDLGSHPDPAKALAGERLLKVLQADFLAGQVKTAVSRFCQSADREVGTKHFRYIDGIDEPKDGKQGFANNDSVKAQLLPHARKLWADLADPAGQLPFTHDAYVKVWQLEQPVIGADYILLDEAQDTAEVMLDIIRQQKHALVVLVGDSAQQIYQWRGACNAMKAFPGADQLFLSQSFRFGQRVADVANAILDLLDEPTELRIRGLPTIRSSVEMKPSAGSIVDGIDCLLCRTNAAAVSALLEAKRAGKRPHIIGKVDDIVSFVEAADDLQNGRRTSYPELACFESWGEVQKYSKADEGEELRLMVKIVDEFGCQVILDALRHMPKEADADVVISTAHKSKGREWGRVRLAGDFPTPDKMDDEDRRLLYVACTRAKLHLDLGFCPAFIGGRDKQSGDRIPGIRVKFSPEEDGTAWNEEVKPIDEVIPAYDPNASVPPKVEPPGEFARNYGDEKPAAAKAPAGFSWAKGRQGDWLVRGPIGFVGKQVTVKKRSGQESQELLGSPVWASETEGVCLYRTKGEAARTERAVCAECGQPGHLVADDEDGLLKHRQCCDMPPN